MAERSSIFRHSFRGGLGPLLQLQQQDASPELHQSVSPPMPMKSSTASQSQTSDLPLPANDGIDAELWYACAGPHRTLPPINSEVAYFPQGHIEQVASFNNQDVDGQIPRYNLPAVIPCSLNDIQLSADPETDEVYATLTLCPLGYAVDESISCADPPARSKRKSNSFTKTLTVSDTSTHGGFSVPRRAAEECLPTLDKSQDPPTQELVAKDLHGNEWKFRHIFRGQPKRHLLTTGWSVFVSQKRLLAGDAVLFLRGENGQLRIGVRRAPRQQQKSKVLTSPTMTIGVLAAAAHAASEKSRFSLIYNPRSCLSEFVLSYRKYFDAVNNTYTVGQRFKMRHEPEDATDRRYTGTITGIRDFDSSRWPNSPWRSLQVNWDESPSCERQQRVSPWEIGPFTGCTTLPPQVGPRKRTRTPSQAHTVDHTLGADHRSLKSLDSSALCLARSVHENGNLTPILEEGMDHDETLSSKVSYGIKREDGFKTDNHTGALNDGWYALPARDSHSRLSGSGLQDLHGNDGGHQYADERDSGVNLGGPFHRPSPTLPMLNSFSNSPLFGDSGLELCAPSAATREEVCHNRSCDFSWSGAGSAQQPSQISPDSENCGPSWLSSHRSYVERIESPAIKAVTDCAVRSMSSIPPLDSTSSSHPPAARPTLWEKRLECDSDRSPTDRPSLDQTCRIFGVPFNSPVASKEKPGTTQVTVTDDIADKNGDQVLDNSGTPLSSASMGGSEPKENGQKCNGGQSWSQAPVRTYTKVHKQGAIGRSLDVTKFDGYSELLQEVQEMFGLEGEAFDKKSGWQLVYTDHEGDVLLVGDDPWVEFCSCVRSIRVLSPGESLSAGMSPSTSFTDRGRVLQIEGGSGKDAANRKGIQSVTS